MAVAVLIDDVDALVRVDEVEDRERGGNGLPTRPVTFLTNARSARLLTLSPTPSLHVGKIAVDTLIAGYDQPEARSYLPGNDRGRERPVRIGLAPSHHDKIAVISARRATYDLMNRLIARHGVQPEAWVPHFERMAPAVVDPFHVSATRRAGGGAVAGPATWVFWHVAPVRTPVSTQDASQLACELMKTLLLLSTSNESDATDPAHVLGS